MERARIEALQGTPMFGGILDEAVIFLLERVSSLEVPAGDYFFRQGEVGRSAFLLERGRVSVLKSWGDRDHLLRHLADGDCFGEVALLDFRPRSASVLADVDCSAIEISAKHLRQLAERHIEQFAMIYMNLGRELSRRLREADERLFRSRFEVDEAAEDHAFSHL